MNAAQKLIAENKQSRASYLDLSNCGLSTLPDELLELNWLEELNLSNSFKALLAIHRIRKYTRDKFYEHNKKNYIIGVELCKLAKLLNLRKLYLSESIGAELKFLREFTQLTVLDLSNNNVTDLTPLKGLTQLTNLDLHGNKITDLTPLQKLTQLTNLDLHKNKITDLTPLQGLTNLNSLDLYYNKITDLTPLQELTKLSNLNLRYNNIADFAPLQGLTQLTRLDLHKSNITDLTPLQGLTQLTNLDLHGNYITDLTPLQGLTKLNSLDLYYNRITDLTPLQELTNLTLLNLHENNITDLTPLQGLTRLTHLSLYENDITDLTPLQKLTQLTNLDLHKNKITDLTPLQGLSNLYLLYVNTNAITTITKDILKLKSLKYFNLRNNPVRNIPFELLNTDNCLQMLKDYYQSLESETEFLYEAKLVLAGNGRVGKTTISKNMISDYGVSDSEESTHGIEVRKWKCKFSKEDFKEFFNNLLPPHILAVNVNWTKLKEEGFRFNIWDFGGQGKYRAVQQFFCSRNSLYLYVTSPDDETINYNDVYINFSYWIPFISAFGFNQSQNHKSPIIYIYNKTDKITGNGFQKKKNIKDQVEAAAKGESILNINDVIDLSCKNASEVEALRTQIRRVLPFISDDVFTRRYGKGWLDTKQELESLHEPFITKEQYVSLFKNNVRKYQELIQAEEESQAETWLTVLDAIGAVIYFSEEKVNATARGGREKAVQLSQIVILKPEWLKEIAYEILNCEVVINRRGEFDAHDFDKIWPKVAPQQYDLLIQMMLAFELCYHSEKFGREVYVVPALFPEQTPFDYQQGFEDLVGTNTIQKYILEFSPFMPAGVLHKLVIAKNGWIYQEIKWLTGVVLHRKNTYIEITEQWDQSTITLLVAGERPDWMQDEIINEIGRITDSIRSTKYLYELRFNLRKVNTMEKSGNTIVPIKLFISYSHAYKEYYQVFKEKFETATKPLQNDGKYRIEIFSDEQIPIGSNWHNELQREVLKCDVAILLVSDALFTSAYIQQQELNRFIDRHSNDQILIVPIYFHPCDYDSWGKLQEIQFFKPEGAKYGRPELGTNFSFADLVNFYSANGQLMVTPNLNISRYMTDLVNKLKPEFARIASKKMKHQNE